MRRKPRLATKRPKPPSANPARKAVVQARRSVPRFASLDAAGAAYARLLNDPCAAPLAAPVYMGTGAGYLTRATFDASFTQDSGYIALVPGCWGTGATTSAVVYATGSSSGSTLAGTYTPGPGSGFLAGVAQEARPVAACLQLMYTGTELNRAGVINRSQINGNESIGFSGNTADAIAGSFPLESRMPDSQPIEVKWAPGILDGDFAYAGTTQTTGQRGAVAILWRGLGSGTIKVRATVVYEWRPTPSEGVIAPSASGSKSRNTMDEIVGVLSAAAPNWAYEAARYAAPAVANLVLPGSGSLVSRFFR